METNQNEVRLSDLGAQQAGIEITPTAADPVGLRTEPINITDPIVEKVLNAIADNTLQTKAALQNEAVEEADKAFKVSPVTSEEFFAEGTTPLADTTISSPKLIVHVDGVPTDLKDLPEGTLPDESLVGMFDKIVAVTGWQGENPLKVDSEPKKYTPIYIGLKNRLYLERKPAVIDGDRTQLTETQMGAVVEEVLDQTVSENFDPTAIIPGETGPIRYGNPSTIDQMIVNSKLSAVYFRITELETFNAKLLLALKQHGFDTVKLFR